LRTGDFRRADDYLGHCDVSTLSQSDASRWHRIRGFVLREAGCPGEGLSSFREGIRIAEPTDLVQLCLGQIALFHGLLDQHGAQVCESLAADVRNNVIRSGDPLLFANLHTAFAEYEGRRGNLSDAFRHLDAGFRIVEATPNAWLTSRLWLIRSAAEIAVGSAAKALRCARRARDAAKASGHERATCAALSNIAFLSLWTRDHEQAEGALREAANAAPKGGLLWFALLDSKANWCLISGEHESCDDYLRAGETEVRVRNLPPFAAQPLDLRLSRSRLEAARGRFQDAERVLEEGEPYVLKRGDRVLQAEWIVETAWQKIQRGDLSSASHCLDRLATVACQGDVGRRADVHWLRGHLARAGGDSDVSRREFARANRIWQELGGRHPSRVLPLAGDAIAEEAGASGDICDVAAITTLMSLGSRPRLLGVEAASLIGCDLHATRVRVTVGPPGSRRIICDRQRPETPQPKSPTHSVDLGDEDGLPYQLQVYASDRPGSITQITSILSLVEASVGLARLQRDERHRTSLWPVEEGLMLEGNLFVAPRMREIHSMARRVGPSDLPVLITGETGSGKEIIAREVHCSSSRARMSFGVLVCSAVPREMLDSHLFGHRKGAFTGAIDSFLGVIRANEGGTLFLDEIGEVSLDLQVKLLRFLETGEVHPLGETKPVKVDVRVIAATNQPLEALMKEGRFREDLFYRLNVVRVGIPPLRERREEILPFFERFLMRECARIGRPVPNLSDEVVEHLLLYKWPGNVRQVLNEVKRVLATLPAGVEITPAALSSDITEERKASIAKAVAASPNQMLVRTDQPLAAAIEDVERAMLKGALASSPDLEAAAEKLDITRKGLFLKRQRLGLE
jgi:DNA-binding NtrC family response regulator